MMKRTKLLLTTLMLTFVMLLASATCTYAASKTVEVNSICSSGVTKKRAKKIAGKIGKMKLKKSKRFKTAYYVGNKMIIGINRDVNILKYKYPYPPYSYIVNKGNKRVTYRGVKIGDSKKTVARKLGYKRSAIKENTVTFGGAGGYLICTFKNGKLKKWVFDCSATG